MEIMMYKLIQKNELYHHGIIGQKWGIRRYQNYDGTLTALGRQRLYGTDGELTTEGKQYLRKTLDNSESATEFAKKGKYLLSKQVKEMQGAYDKVSKANDKLKKTKELTENSKAFKDLERELSDKIYDAVGADEWCNSKQEYYSKYASNPKSSHYIWDEDDPDYYLQSDKRFYSYQKAEKEYRDAWDEMRATGSSLAKGLIDSINDQYGPHDVRRLKTDGEIYKRMLYKVSSTLEYFIPEEMLDKKR